MLINHAFTTAIFADGSVGRQLSRARARALFYVAGMALDSAAITVGVTVAAAIRFDRLVLESAASLLAVLLPLFVVFSIRGLSPTLLCDWRSAAARSVSALALSIVLIVSLGFWMKANADLSRLMLAYSMTLSCLLIVASRFGIGVAARRVFQDRPVGVLLIREEVTVDVPAGVDLFDAGLIGLGSGPADPFVLDRLARCLPGYDHVVVACAPERRRAWSMALRGCGVRADLLIPELREFGAVGRDHFAGHATVPVSAGHLRMRDRVIKRGLDTALAFGALVFLAPLMIFVTLAIRFESRGATLFVQDRVGFGNKLFRVYKFRSMRAATCDDAGACSTARGDERVTRVGRFIRATSIDELPQLFNILLGDMSFVGPRPHATGSLAGGQRFWEVDDRYHHRHACKPGLTGLAQVRGYRGATHQREDLLNRLQADLEYVSDWNIWRDLGIMAATLKVVVHRNAF